MDALKTFVTKRPTYVTNRKKYGANPVPTRLKKPRLMVAFVMRAPAYKIDHRKSVPYCLMVPKFFENRFSHTVSSRCSSC
jgi:hypothetical protein